MKGDVTAREWGKYGGWELWLLLRLMGVWEGDLWGRRGKGGGKWGRYDGRLGGLVSVRLAG